MCYDHNKCRFQYYIGLLSKPLNNYSSQKKPELNQTKKTNLHSYRQSICLSIDMMAVLKGKSDKNVKKVLPISGNLSNNSQCLIFWQDLGPPPKEGPSWQFFFLSNCCGNLKRNFEILYKSLWNVEKWKNEKFTKYCFVYVNIFERTLGPYVNISKHFADHLPTPKCKHNLWRLPY